MGCIAGTNRVNKMNSKNEKIKILYLATFPRTDKNQKGWGGVVKISCKFRAVESKKLCFWYN